MRLFTYERAGDRDEAVRLGSAEGAQYLAGGTTIVDLMKLDVQQPRRLVDINDLARADGIVESGPDGLRLGALATMASVADHPAVVADYPVIAQSLQLAASTQIRNMATLGGNVLQRTRCNYFRSPSWTACNKRAPGSGCAAIEGVNRRHAVLGTSEHCIATYPGDFAQALVALDATAEIVGGTSTRVVPFEALHRLPADAPHLETHLEPGELITSFHVPAGPWTRRSLYLKVRDRESYEFALASAAVALDMRNGTVRDARIALGGVATRPWRAREAEILLSGQALTEAAARAAAERAFAEARTHGGNAFKPELGRRTVRRALMMAARMQV